MTKRLAILCCLTGVFFFHLPPVIFAQTNSWTNSVSGKWEDTYWSLGILPGTNQTAVVLTNEGVKTLMIDSNTVQKFPESFFVGFITISAPTNSFNTLMVTNAELPFMPGITVGSNSALELYSSSLGAEEFFLGGNFIANDSQILAGDGVYAGYNALGIFNMTNSFLNAWDEYLGGSFPGIFNQQGGINSPRFVYLKNGGEYNLFDGGLGTPTNAPAIYFQGDSEFNQFGGSNSASLVWLSGICQYHLAGGNFSCSNLDIPYQHYSGPFCDAYFWQSGGTNVTGQIELGSDVGPGAYSLAAGVLVSSGLVLRDHFLGFNPGEEPFASVFLQSGGFHTNGGIQISGAADEDYYIYASVYALSNGILETPSISLGMGEFDQSGGTNLANTVSLNNVSIYSLSAGWLIAQKLEVTGDGGPYPFGGGGKLTTFQHLGGTNLICGTLSLTWDSSYEMRAGELIVQNVSLGDSTFYHYGGIVNLQAILELTNGIWREQADGGELGQLQLDGGTNSVSFAKNSCILRFIDSSGVLWSNAAVLVISNWSGSLYGGGSQQIIFGANSAALTPQQLSQIQFQNPAGLPPGNYPARILATGEIVPTTGESLPTKMTIACSPTNAAMQLNLSGDIGQTYDIEVSTDLLNWTRWTNQFNSNGTIWIFDCATNSPQKFYRARVAP